MNAPIRINEIFHSIQGESLLAGKPTVFVRTSACNLRCVWCDTGYSFWKGKLMPQEDILKEVAKYECHYVCVTGGEPLGQRGTLSLLGSLVESEYTVSLETNGSFPVKDVPKKVVKVVDIKCPDSKESEANLWENIDSMTEKDQFKFVVASKNDFDWAQAVCEKHSLYAKCPILFSPVHGKVKPADLAEWILSSKTPATLQLQLHKQIWEKSEHR